MLFPFVGKGFAFSDKKYRREDLPGGIILRFYGERSLNDLSMYLFPRQLFIYRGGSRFAGSHRKYYGSGSRYGVASGVHVLA